LEIRTTKRTFRQIAPYAGEHGKKTNLTLVEYLISRN